MTISIGTSAAQNTVEFVQLENWIDAIFPGSDVSQRVRDEIMYMTYHFQSNSSLYEDGKKIQITQKLKDDYSGSVITVSIK
jgi:hypothetical protein